MSDTQNVKLGVCKVIYDGVDLGYTKGGVEVGVATETHKVEVDQFGKTAVNELIMARNVSAKVPLAETTLDNLVRIMPGATLVSNGVKASGSATFSAQPTANDAIVIGGIAFTFKATASGPTDIVIGATLAATLLNAVTVINSHPSLAVSVSASATVLTITAETAGVAGNLITTTKTAGTVITISGATLTGGTDATLARVDVTTGVGMNLLSIAKALVLHPIDKADTDRSEDFTILKAATAGALQFAYKLEEERVFNVEFNGYPDVANGNKLFTVGHPHA